MDIEVKHEEDDISIDSEQTVAIDDMSKNAFLDEQVGDIVQFVKGKYSKAETARRGDEERWIQAYRNYRGLYSPEVQFTSTEKSRVFVKVTKTKVLVAYGQLVEVLFGGNKFPLSIDPTVLPDGVEDTVSLETNPKVKEAKDEIVGAEGESSELLPRNYPEFIERIDPLKDDLSGVEDDLQLKSTGSPTSVNFHPAMVVKQKMEKKIHDQLEESNAKKQLRSQRFESDSFGTGIMKEWHTVDKEYPNWDEDGVYSPLFKHVPQTSNVSIWNFYPDPDANNMDEAEYVWEQHKDVSFSATCIKT